MALSIIKNLHTALPLTATPGTGLNANNQPRSNAAAVFNPNQAQPVHKLARKGKATLK